MTVCEIRDEVEALLKRLPSEIHLDLGEAAARFREDTTVKNKVEDLLK